MFNITNSLLLIYNWLIIWHYAYKNYEPNYLIKYRYTNNQNIVFVEIITVNCQKSYNLKNNWTANNIEQNRANTIFTSLLIQLKHSFCFSPLSSRVTSAAISNQENTMTKYLNKNIVLLISIPPCVLKHSWYVNFSSW